MNFYKKFFRGTVCLDQLSEVFESWIKSNSPEDTPCLEFILDEPPPLTPFEKVTVIGVDIPQGLLKLRFRVVFGKWNKEEWEEVAPIDQLPQVVGEFLGVVDPQDKCIYVQMDPFPCKFGQIDLEDQHVLNPSPEHVLLNPSPEVETETRAYGPAIEIPVDEE